jgi:hypothetical protein
MTPWRHGHRPPGQPDRLRQRLARSEPPGIGRLFSAPTHIVPLSPIEGPLLVKIGRMRNLAMVVYCLNKDRSMASAIALYPASFGWR